MRRKEQEITDPGELNEILDRAQVLRLGMIEGGEPYVVPVLFGRKGNSLFVHSAKEGRKLDAIAVNPRVCFEADVELELDRKETPCAWGMKYRSVIGWGSASVLADNAENAKALDVIMAHYGGGPCEYPSAQLDKLVVIKIEIEAITGKRSK